MWYQIIVFSCVTMTDLTNHILVHPSMRFLIRNIFELIELLPKFPNIVHNKKNCTVQYYVLICFRLLLCGSMNCRIGIQLHFSSFIQELTSRFERRFVFRVVNNPKTKQ